MNQNKIVSLFYKQGKNPYGRFVMGSVIGRLDGQVAKIFLGNNLTKSTIDYDKMLQDENLSEEERERIKKNQRKKEEEDIIL